MCESDSYTVVSDPLRPHGLWPTRLLYPQSSLSNNIGGWCHSFLQGILPTQGTWVSCITISRAWIPEWWIGAVPHFPSASSNREPECSYHTVALSPFLLWWFSLLSRFSSWPVSSLQSSPWWPAVHRPCYADGAVGCIFSVICRNFDDSFCFLEGLFFANFQKFVFGGRHYFSN